jgi:hypothetical protein
MATGSDWMSRYPVGEVCACTTGNCTISTPSGAFSPEMTTSSDTRSDRRSRDPEEGWKGVRMRNQKLHNIHPSGDFSSEMTSSTGGLPLDFSYISPCGCSLGRPWKGPTWGGYCAISGCACAHLTHGVTWHSVTSGSHNTYSTVLLVLQL